MLDLEVLATSSMMMKKKTCLAHWRVSVVLPGQILEHWRTNSKTSLKRTSRTKRAMDKTMTLRFFESLAEIS